MDDFDLLDKQLQKPLKQRKVVKEKTDDSDDEIRISSDGKIIITDKSFSAKKQKKEADAMEEDEEDEDIPEEPPSEAVYQGSFKYRTGGKGIHRNMDMDEMKTGKEFRSKKGKGDVKKKGQADPYAYYPLIRSSLNRRKKQLAKGQFKQLTTKKKNRK